MTLTLTLPLVFLDTETTHLDRWRRRPWEIAVVRREIDGTESALHMMISDVDLTDADQAALTVGRFYQRHPVWSTEAGPMDLARGDLVPEPGDPTMCTERVATLAVEWITRGAQIVGSNPEFDITTLASMFHRNGVSPSWHYQPWDVKSLVAGLVGTLPLSQRHAAELVSVTVPEKDVHTAMGDVLVCKAIFDVVMERER